MSQTKFKNFFLENILDFLWRQWSSLGVAGGARPEEDWIIDPEALLLFSLQMTRYEPRFFDEILDWLVINGKFIDIQRLRSILKTQNEKTQRLVCAVACFVSHEAPSYQRKWQPLSLFKRGTEKTQDEILFITRKGEPYPRPKAESMIFYDYGFSRDDFVLRKMSRPVSVTLPSNIRFLLRALFGIGSRPECILYLLTHEAGHPAEVAEVIGISVRGTQDALIELAESSLVLTRSKGKRKIEYYLNQKKWWDFLFGPTSPETKLAYLNWVTLFSALNNVWSVLSEVEKAESDYLRSSQLRQAMENISLEFSKSGLALPPVPTRDVRPEKYETEFQNFITKVLGARSGTGK